MTLKKVWAWFLRLSTSAIPMMRVSWLWILYLNILKIKTSDPPMVWCPDYASGCRHEEPEGQRSISWSAKLCLSPSEADWLYGINLDYNESIRAFSKAAMHESMGAQICAPWGVSNYDVLFIGRPPIFDWEFLNRSITTCLLSGVAPTADGKDATTSWSKWVRHAFKEPVAR